MTISYLACRHCGLPWPGDKSLTMEDLAKGEKIDLPICIMAPPKNRWFVDSGINGHVFDRIDRIER